MPYKINSGEFLVNLKRECLELKSFPFESPRHMRIFSKLRSGDNETFRKLVKRCISCPIHQERHFSPVLPQGDLDSYHIIIGRNPGQFESQDQILFHPEAPGGDLLSKYFRHVMLLREDTYITNALFCWTRDDRPPVGDEAVRCSLWKPLEFSCLKKPKFIWALGNDAMRLMTWFDAPSILKTYGLQYLYIGDFFHGQKVYVFPILHPGYVLRNSYSGSFVVDHLRYLEAVYFKPFRKFLSYNPTEEEIGNWTIDQEK